VSGTKQQQKKNTIKKNRYLELLFNFGLINYHLIENLTNTFHVAVHLFSNRSQMTSKCGKNKKSGTRGDSRVCHWCSYHILTSSVIFFWTDARQHGIYLFYTIKKHTTSAFYFKIFLNCWKAGLCPLWQNEKKAIWRNLFPIQNEAIPLNAKP